MYIYLLTMSLVTLLCICSTFHTKWRMCESPEVSINLWSTSLTWHFIHFGFIRPLPDCKNTTDQTYTVTYMGAATQTLTISQLSLDWILHLPLRLPPHPVNILPAIKRVITFTKPLHLIPPSSSSSSLLLVSAPSNNSLFCRTRRFQLLGG